MRKSRSRFEKAEQVADLRSAIDSAQFREKQRPAAIVSKSASRLRRLE